MIQTTLFGEIAPAAPEGFFYYPNFLTADEEQVLIAEFKTLPLEPYKFGEYEGKRRVCNFGGDSPLFPDWLTLLARRAEKKCNLASSSLSTAHLIEYSLGAPIGWHRDMPGYGEIVGISLASSCRFRLRRQRPDGKWNRYDITAEPRSIYLMSGPSRYEWQHSIPPVEQLRYSITMRTLTH